jgi:hypothetical protein
MTVIALETELVRTSFDPKTRKCYYTIRRNGQHWTVAIPLDDLDKHKANKQKRRNHLANALTVAMRGAPDPALGSKTDPFKPATWQDFDTVPVGAWYVNPADGKLQQKAPEGGKK